MQWRNYRIVDIFDVKNTHSILKSQVRSGGSYPYVTAGEANNSITSYVDYDMSCIEPGNCICIGGKTTVITYQAEDFFSNDSHNLTLYPKSDAASTEQAQLFMVTCLKKSLSKYYWGDSISRAKIQNDVVCLPCDSNGNPDYVYMAEYISAIREERKHYLRLFLRNAGYDDLELTKSDVELLTRKIETKSFRVGDLFDVLNNPQLDKKYFVFDELAEYPYFTRTENNNGVLGYVEYLDEAHKIRGNSLAVGMISMRFHYMPHDFYAGQFTKTLIPKFEEFDELIAMYFITELNARSEYYQGYLVREFASRVKDTMLDLPVTDKGKPDYDYMRAYIRAQQKQVLGEAMVGICT